MSDEEAKLSSAFERHAQTALVLLTVGLLSWVGFTTHKTALTLATIEIEIRHLDEVLDIDHLKFDEIEQRLDNIEKAIVAHTNNGQHGDNDVK